MAQVPDNPDRECNNCGSRDWSKFEERKPTDYPKNSDVKKHYFSCDNCSANGFAFEENGSVRYTAGLR